MATSRSLLTVRELSERLSACGNTAASSGEAGISPGKRQSLPVPGIFGTCTCCCHMPRGPASFHFTPSCSLVPLSAKNKMMSPATTQRCPSPGLGARLDPACYIQLRLQWEVGSSPVHHHSPGCPQALASPGVPQPTFQVPLGAPALPASLP